MGGGGWGDYGDWANCTSSRCRPTGTFIPWAVALWRPDSESDWEEPSSGDSAECTINAAINFCYTGNPSSQDRARLASFEWKRDDSCPDECAQPYIPYSGPKGYQVYHVRRLGPYSCSLAETGHAICALYNGPPTEAGYRSWGNWQFFQYGDTYIGVGSENCNDQIPRPITSNDTVKVTISHIAGLGSDLSSGPTLAAGAKIVTFDIPRVGNPTADP